MELTEYHIGLLEKKFLNQLTKEEERALLDLEKNDAFVEEASKYLAVFEAISSDAEAGLRANMDRWEAEVKKSRPLPTLGRLLRIAAILVVVIGSIFYFSDSFTGSSDEISEFYEPFPNRVTVRSSTIDSTLGLGLLQYDNGDYPACIETLGPRTDETSLLYLGHCYFNLGDYDQATEAYRKVIEFDPAPSKWKETAEWYVTLSNLKLDSFDRSATSFQTLQRLTTAKHAYRDQAERLLLLLEKTK
ncbi:MAG: tetratricopeptide repeat protein [Bacteroidia bacterium]|nr:tetratricopeptide repeat protein [Bacteroidia bacterium]